VTDHLHDGVAGKVVTITGASSGIGAATARLLAARGARVVLGARRGGRLAEVAGGVDGDVVTRVTDVRRRADLAALVDLARERFGRLDVLVASAGVAHVAPVDDLAVDGWDEMLDVNVRGVLHGIAAALPVFRAQGGGQFVTVVSTAGLRVVPGQAVYAATKNAVRTLCEGLRQEAGPDLRVTAVSPGVTDTEFIVGAGEPDVVARYAAMAMPADAVARAVAYAIEQPPGVDVNEIVVRPTAQA
jgi:NADP-dependent 3-hydroxy acid dehydrogenase YdfG